MAINIQEILHPSDSDSIKFEKINYNFDQILANGGGPAGPKGQKGDQGQVGSTGQKGQKGEVGPIGEKGVAGSTDSPWYKVSVDVDNDSTVEVSILKPKKGTDLNLPVIWLGDPNFEEDVTDGDTSTNARLTIANDTLFENFLKLQHSSDKQLVLTSSVVDGYTRFNWQNEFQNTLIEYGINTDKITLVANTSTFGISGHSINLIALGNSNIKLSTPGTGILDVDINAEFKGYLRLPAGTTGDRPNAPQVGMIRFNTDLDVVEAYYSNSGSPEWRELCTDCGAPVADSIGIGGGDINANADGTPASDTVTISGGDINANTDGSPVGSVPTPTPTSGSGAGPTPTPTSGSGAGPTPTPTSGSGAGPTPTPTCPDIISVNALDANSTSASNSYTSIGGWCMQTQEDTEGEVWYFNPSAVGTPELYYYHFAGGAGTNCASGSNLDNTIQGTEYSWAGGVLTPTVGTELWITARTWTSEGQSYQVVIETSGNGLSFELVHFVPIC